MNSELECKACTFINERGTKICNACGKTLNAPSIDFGSNSGIVCLQCTYNNPALSLNCRVCDSILDQDVVVSNSSGASTSKSTSVTEECHICFSPMLRVFKMPLCSHIFCENCAKQHFTAKITHYGIDTFRCPMDVCGYFGDLTNRSTYFNRLKTLLKSVLDQNTYEVFKRKIAILDNIDKPGFVRCPLCNHGFVHNKSKMAYCPGCSQSFCFTCMTKWISGHSKVDCKSEKNWSADTNVFCPKCKYKFFLERGGCMHITCTQCSYEYCEFCFTKITGKGKSCDFANCNKQKSLHGHHPRSCMYYVQEMDHTQLEALMQLHVIAYRTSESRSNSKCDVKVTVETDGIWLDSVCNKPATKAYNNMCLHHYKWQLGEIMKRHSIDVVDVMNSLECSCELKRNNIQIPNARSEYKAIEDNHTFELRKLIRLRIPYKNMSQ